MKVSFKIYSAIISIAVGLMFIILKDDIIGIALTLVGIGAVIMAIVDFVNRQIQSGVIKAIIGVAVLVLGWVFVDIAIYIIAGALIALGISQIITAVRLSVFGNILQKVFMFIKPVATLAAGLCLFFNKGGTMDWIFILSGVLILVEGLLSLADPSDKTDE